MRFHNLIEVKDPADLNAQRPRRNLIAEFLQRSRNEIVRLSRIARQAHGCMTLWLHVNLLEIEIGEVHITVRQDVHGENISPFVETNLEKLRSQIPVVPLTPGQRI